MKKRIIGDYNIIKQIGQGALGTVCLAEHRFMKKQYALKVLPEELAADRAFIKRFEKEIKTLSTLDHPHIVKVHNVSSAKGTYFLVTDCVVDDMGETTNLAQYITTHEGPIAEDELVRMLKQVVGALDHIHTRTQGEGAMAHRGLKLNNVLVGKGKKGVDLFLSDCGLSNVIGSGAVLSRAYKALGDTLDVTVVETTKGGEEKYPSKPSDPENVQRLNNSFLQHLAFLAPEQRNTNGAVAAVSSDIYAFGVMTYYLITGEYPEGIFDMPSALRPEYRLPWDDFIKACMQKDPARRPTSLLGAFDDLLNQRHNNEDGFVTYTMKKPQPKTTEKIEEKELVAVGAIKAPAKQEKNKASEPKALLAEMSDLKPAIKEKALETPTYEEDPAATIRVDRSVTHYEPEPVKHIDIEPIMTDMVVIKGGKFFRGSNDGNRDEMPRHEVNIESIAVDIHPVTNEQFIRFLEAMGGEKDVNNNDTIQLRESRINRRAGSLSIESGYGKHPAAGVTWYGAVAYAKWVGKRLPTEAEWEIAARGSNENSPFPVEGDMEKTKANYFSSDTIAVKSYAPSNNGLYDIVGNVYEWCQDWYGYNYYEASEQEPNDPQGPIQGVYRVLRGGCWKSLKEDLRCSHRHRNNPGAANSTCGFRCVSNVE